MFTKILNLDKDKEPDYHPSNNINRQFTQSMKQELDLPTRFDMSFNYYSWRKAYETCNGRDINQLIRQIEDKKIKNSLEAYKFYYKDSEIDTSKLIPIVDKGGRGSEWNCKKGIENTFDSIDPVFAALLSHWIRKIELRKVSPAGVYMRPSRKIIIDTRSSSTVCHEIAHALHDMMGVYSWGIFDNRRLSRKRIKLDIMEKNILRNTNKAQENLKDDIRTFWKNYDKNNSISNYQNKSVNELLAVGFEQWVTRRRNMKQKQPELCNIFDTYYGRLEEN